MTDSGGADDITAVENALRDLIESLLAAPGGADWLASSGLTENRLALIHARRDEDAARRRGGIAEHRPLYYTDLPDLQTIVDHQWELFKPCLETSVTSTSTWKGWLGSGQPRCTAAISCRSSDNWLRASAATFGTA
jgi:hypothetical protein